MNDDTIADLKQFISTTVGQATASLKTELGETLKVELSDVIKTEINVLRQEMQDGFAGVADAITPVHDDLANHERRIIKLEQQAA